MVEGYYSILNSIFSPILSLSPFIAEIIISAIITFIIALLYRFLINQNTLREVKTKQKENQEKTKELQKTNPDEANKLLAETISLSRKQFRLTMKPMMLTLVVVMILLPWMAYIFPGIIVKLPFYLPYFENDFGWLAWYMIVSIPLGQIFRKLLGAEL
jgi:uncharacterized membrane protein (DUF106 family)